MNINFIKKEGKVIFNDLSLSEDRPLFEQLDVLKEDMLQVEFPGGYILDVGWRPSFNLDGSFCIYIIKDFDWGTPVYNCNAKDISSLKLEIKNAMKIIKLKLK